MNSVENLIEKILKYLILVFPFLLVSGPFLPDLVCVLIGLFYIFYLIKERNFEYFKNYKIFFLIIFFFYININSFISFNPLISFGSTLGYGRIILFILGLSYLLNKYPEIKISFFYFSLICYFLLLFDSTFQFIYGKNIIGFELLNNSRISSFFGDEFIMGSFISRLLPLLLGLSFLLTDHKNIKIIRFFLVFCSLILVIYSGERLATAYMFFIITFYFYIDFNKKKILAFLIIFGIIFSILPREQNTFVNRIFTHTYNQYKETGSVLKFSYRHYLHYQTAYKMFLDNIMFGQGVKSFRYLCDKDKFSINKKIVNDNTLLSNHDAYINLSNDGSSSLLINLVNNLTENKNIITYKIPKKNILEVYVEEGSFVKKGDPIIAHNEFKDGCNTHPHSLYMQFLSELGLIGFMFIVIVFSFAIYNLIGIGIRKLNNNINSIDKFNAFIYLGIFMNFFPFLPSGNFFNNWMLLIVHIPIGFYMALNQNKK